MASVLDAFHPAVRAWFAESFGAPSEVQERGWPVIAAAAGAQGHHVLLCAPTGSGKTLAAFMWAIDRLVGEAYWLYVVSISARLLRVQHPFREPIATAKDGVIIDQTEVLRAAGERPL